LPTAAEFSTAVLFFQGFLHEQLCFFGAELAVDFKFFPHEALVGNEEILDLMKQMFVEIAEVIAIARILLRGEPNVSVATMLT
jgi:hypothetical protein